MKSIRQINEELRQALHELNDETIQDLHALRNGRAKAAKSRYQNAVNTGADDATLSKTYKDMKDADKKLNKTAKHINKYENLRVVREFLNEIVYNMNKEADGQFSVMPKLGKRDDYTLGYISCPDAEPAEIQFLLDDASVVVLPNTPDEDFDKLWIYAGGEKCPEWKDSAKDIAFYLLDQVF